MKLRALPVMATLFFAFAGSLVAGAPPPSPPPSAGLKAQLENAMSDAEKKLGKLEPWQKRIFDEEAVPHAQRFIRDYRQTANGLNAVIDFDSLQGFLHFYGPTVLKRENPPVLVLLMPETGCAKCQGELDAIKEMVQKRLERRGMVPQWATVVEVSGSSNAKPTPAALAALTASLPKGRALSDQLARVAEARKLAGSLLVEWRAAEPEASDSAHADELKFAVYTGINLRDFGHHEGREEIFDTDSFEVAATQLLTETFTELGKQAQSGQVQVAHAIEMDKDPVTVEVRGIGDFAQYSQLRARLQEKLRPLGNLEELKLARGQAVFAIYTERSGEELKAALSGVALDHGKVSVTGASKQSVELEIAK